jgi:ferredoxin-NADP reductase
MKLKLAARKTESPGVESFIFKPEEPLIWKAGQFLHYILNHKATDDRGSDRWFTIASAPCERRVMLTTRFASKQGSTFKKTLKAALHQFWRDGFEARWDSPKVGDVAMPIGWKNCMVFVK